jgi:hypothetical protein
VFSRITRAISPVPLTTRDVLLAVLIAISTAAGTATANTAAQATVPRADSLGTLQGRVVEMTAATPIGSASVR